jgi:hypothetical protein
VGAAVSAARSDDSGLAIRLTESNELFTEELDRDGRAVRVRQLPGEESRYPVAAHQLPHRRSGSHAGQSLVLLSSQHLSASIALWKGEFTLRLSENAVTRGAGQDRTQETVIAGKVTGHDGSFTHRERYVACATVDHFVLNALEAGTLEVEADDLKKL